MDFSHYANIYKALGNENRLEIIDICQTPHKLTDLIQKIQLSRTKVTEYVSKLHVLSLVSKKRNSDGTVVIESLIKLNKDGTISRRSI